VNPDTRIIGFVILMVAVFLGAYKAGSLIGPVIPVNAPVQAPGGTPPRMNMNMEAAPGRLAAAAVRSPEHR
jgi:hypothetical protein